MSAAIDDSNREVIPAKAIRTTLLDLEKLLGKAMTDEVFVGFTRLGIDLSNDDEGYFAHEIREALEVMFGRDAAELFMQMMKSMTN